MSLQDQMRADVAGVFLKGNGDFEIVATLNPQGESSRPVKIVIDAGLEEEFDTGTADIDYDEQAIWMSAVNDVDGRVTPKVIARKAQSGDSITINGKTWFFIAILDDSEFGMHHILIRDQKVPWGNEL